MLDVIGQIADWAWMRHHNPLSWYIRPLFVPFFCYFAWRRSLSGIAGVLVALLSSVAWFPAPRTPDPKVIAYLAAERRWLSDPGMATTLVALVVATLWLTAAAFWSRRWLYALILVNLMPVAKVAFSLAAGGETGWAALGPALLALFVTDAVAALVYLWAGRRSRR